ncbi:hypothetical protein, partial [Actinocorallia lasiicapitis]
MFCEVAMVGTDMERGPGTALTAAVAAALIAGTALGSAGGNVMPELLSGFGRRFALSGTASGAVPAAQLLATAAAAL